MVKHRFLTFAPLLFRNGFGIPKTSQMTSKILPETIKTGIQKLNQKQMPKNIDFWSKMESKIHPKWNPNLHKIAFRAPSGPRSLQVAPNIRKCAQHDPKRTQNEPNITRIYQTIIKIAKLFPKNLAPRGSSCKAMQIF